MAWTAAQVLDKHANLHGILAHPSDIQVGYFYGFAKAAHESLGSSGASMMFAPFQPYMSRAEARVFCGALARGLHSAATFQVTAEMVAAVSAVYERTAAGLLHLEEAELPCDRGFVWLDNPLPFVDKHGRTLLERAMSWDTTAVRVKGGGGGGETLPAVRLAVWTRPDDLGDDEASEIAGREWVDRIGELQLNHAMIVPFGERFSYPSSKMRGEAADCNSDNILAWLHTLWMFLTTEVTAIAQKSLPRAAVRRALRQLSSAGVQVVTLRRARPEKEPDGAAAKVDWSCRWFVQGHWRHMSSTEPWHPHHAIARGQHCAVCHSRLTWVRPYLKGPDSQPLKADTEKVYRLAR